MVNLNNSPNRKVAKSAGPGSKISEWVKAPIFCKTHSANVFWLWYVSPACRWAPSFYLLHSSAGVQHSYSNQPLVVSQRALIPLPDQTGPDQTSPLPDHNFRQRLLRQLCASPFFSIHFWGTAGKKKTCCFSQSLETRTNLTAWS